MELAEADSSSVMSGVVYTEAPDVQDTEAAASGKQSETQAASAVVTSAGDFSDEMQHDAEVAPKPESENQNESQGEENTGQQDDKGDQVNIHPNQVK
jgi:hypothetical protein